MQYQPIVDLTTSELVGFEALMRWQHPKWGQVPPEVFIPLAEQSDLIFELGAFALREAARVGEVLGATRCPGHPALCHGQPLRTPVPRPGASGRCPPGAYRERAFTKASRA